MKKLFTHIAFIRLAFAANAQRHCDLKVQAITPPSYTYPDSIYVGYVVTNLGPDSFKASSDTLYYLVNGSVIGGYINLAIAVNQTDTFAVKLYPSAYSNPADSTRQLCLAMVGINRSADSVTDPDLTNNQSCNSIIQLDVKNVTSNISSVSMYPNPVQGLANFAVDLNQSANVSLKIYDMVGREVYMTNAGKLGAGKHTLSANTDNFANGIYMYQVTVGDETKTGKFNIAK
ncbi:MAG: T9SS type A sorting domain-containing protein [Flavipsychrobacter sp.]